MLLLCVFCAGVLSTLLHISAVSTHVRCFFTNCASIKNFTLYRIHTSVLLFHKLCVLTNPDEPTAARIVPIVYMLRAVRSQPPGAHSRLPGAPGGLRAYGNYILPSVSSRKPSMSSWKLPYARASIWLSYHKLTPSVSSQRPSVSSQKAPVSSRKVVT